MQLVNSADRLYKDKTSEIDEKYTISRDKIFLYFDGYNAEILVNDDIFKGQISDFTEIIVSSVSLISLLTSIENKFNGLYVKLFSLSIKKLLLRILSKFRKISV